MKRCDAFTGLEAGLVLIAFVVVASVFSYVVLSAGFFSIQKSQQVVYSAVEQSSSTLTIGDELYGYKNQTTGDIDILRISLGSPYALMPIELDRISVIFAKKDGLVKIERDDPFLNESFPGPGRWRVIKNTGGFSHGNILSMGEYATVIVNLPGDMQVGPGEYFRISFLPPLGASLSAEKTAPDNIKDTVIIN